MRDEYRYFKSCPCPVPAPPPRPKMAQYMKMIDVPIGYRFTIDGDANMYVRMSDTHYRGWDGEFIINCFVDGKVKTCHHIDVGREVLVRLP